MNRRPSKPRRPAGELGQLRIIAGQWRSRRLQFADGPGLRPTPNRVRETLFNWLAPHIEGARVLDLFSGSGALFFEALSRGAERGLALDSNPEAVGWLRRNLATLGGEASGQVLQADALAYLNGTPTESFDLVFLDPPFHRDLLAPACARLEEGGWLAARAWIYTESETAPSALPMPAGWRLHREKQAGQVHYALWQRGA